jgi:hypothetical protein
MSKIRFHLTGWMVFLAANPVFAQSDSATGPNTAMRNSLIGFLPVGLFLIVLYYFFKRQKSSPLVKLQIKNIERHIEHMERMENLLERIAKQLEDRNPR